jgi:hypothetical protein
MRFGQYTAEMFYILDRGVKDKKGEWICKPGIMLAANGWVIYMKRKGYLE